MGLKSKELSHSATKGKVQLGMVRGCAGRIYEPALTDRSIGYLGIKLHFALILKRIISFYLTDRFASLLVFNGSKWLVYTHR